jgi:hypothetical protein
MLHLRQLDFADYYQRFTAVQQVIVQCTHGIVNSVSGHRFMARVQFT